jgi:hypothetical protein
MIASIAATFEDDDGNAKKRRPRKSTAPSKNTSTSNRFEGLEVEVSSDEDDDTFAPAVINSSCESDSASDVQAGTDLGEISNNEVCLLRISSIL